MRFEQVGKKQVRIPVRRRLFQEAAWPALLGALLAAGLALPSVRADVPAENAGASVPERSLLLPVTLAPAGPSWLPLPPLRIHATAAKGPVEAVWLSYPPDFELKRVPLTDGRADLPYRPRTVDDLQGLRVLTEDRPGTRVSLEPTQALVLWPVDEGSDGARSFGVVNWGQPSGLRATCTDSSGKAVPLEGAREIGDGSFDLGYLQTGFDAQFAVPLPRGAAFPLTLTISDEAGDSVTTTLARRIEAADNAAPVAWPSETSPTTWVAYTQLDSAIKDKTSAASDPSTGGTTPNGDTDISRGSSPYYPSCYYAFDTVNQVFFYRVRILGNPLTNGAYSNGTRSGGDPWDNVTWNLLLDTDGDGWKEFNVVLDGDSGGAKTKDISVVAGSNDGDDLKVYYNNSAVQTVTGETVSNNQITAYGDLVWWGNAGTKNAAVPANPTADGATWDFGRSRAVLHTAANTLWGDGWFVDFQFPLDSLTHGRGGAQIVGVNTPIAFGYSTSNSNSNPLQKDFASQYSYTASSTTRFPYSDVVTLATGITQIPQIGSMSLSAIDCPNSVTVSAYVVDALQVNPPSTGTGTVTDTIASVTFQYYYDANGNGIQDDGSSWTTMATVGSSLNPDTNGDLAPNGTTASFNDWGVVWNTSSLLNGQYLIRVIAVDDQSNTNTKVIGSYIVDTSGNCRVGNNVSWNSFQDAFHLIPQDYFSASVPDTVYMNGSFQPATTYNVAYYDSTGALVYTQSCTSDTFGTMLSSSYSLPTSSPAGAYHSVVYPSTFTPPSTYTGGYSASTNPLLADDIFFVSWVAPGAISPPIVSSPLIAGASSVSGSSVEAPGSTITLYRNGVAVGTTAVLADGTWTLAGLSALLDGDSFYATVTVSGGASGNSNTVYVAANATSDLTPPPVINYPVPALSTSVSGTSTAPVGSTLDVYADGVYLGSTTVTTGGLWTLPGLSPLASGTILTATTTAPCPTACTGTSVLSGPVIVGTMLMLLRSDAMTTLTQDRSSIFVYSVAQPPYPSLQPLGPNHVFNSTEGSTGGQPSAPGTADDDKAYLRDIHTGDVDPDVTVLTDNGRPLVFYELLDNNAHTLYLKKSGGQIVFTIDAP